MSNEQNTTNTEDQNKLITERKNKLKELRDGCSANGHRNDFERKDLAGDLLEKFGEFSKPELEEQDNQVSVAGRIMFQRGPFTNIDK